MAQRNLLHIKHLNDFKSWCNENNIETRPPSGEYQVLQIKTKKGFESIYKKERAKEHFSVPESLVNLVVRFYKEKGDEQ